ncbi:MAG: hypothetical protein RL226_297, partial [Bacteroidota bacterium]
IIKEDGCANLNGDLILKFAKNFQEIIEVRKRDGYELKSVKVNFIVYWLKEGTDSELKIVLPELRFERKHHDN